MTGQKRKTVTRWDDVMTEDGWTRWVIDLARRTGWMVTPIRPAPIPGDESGRRITHLDGDKGWPDLALARPGVFLARELKTNHGALSKEQRVWLAHLGPFGGVWRPRDRDEVVATLTARRGPA